MQKKSLSRYWLIIGVSALAIAGLYSLVLAGGRSPKVGESALLGRLFHEALVVHVDLSVLVWFLSIACLLWSQLTKGGKLWIPYIEEASLICFALGTFSITLSPFAAEGEALMSNYIPVIYNPIFFFGLMMVLCGTALMSCKALFAESSGDFAAPIEYALRSAAVITLMALGAFYWSFHQMPAVIDGQQYYDMLFWGGGHVLQFTHVQILMVTWILLMAALVPGFSIKPKMLYGLFSIGLVVALATPIAYLKYEISDSGHRDFFTHSMIVAGGVAPAIIFLLIAAVLFKVRKPKSKPVYSALLMSITLFIYGGILGGMIQGQNVVIPAHYHGSIVGVTLAFMGLAYFMLPRLGYRDISSRRLASLQPYVYGIGQIMHVTGFAWSGGYGALRKTPGGVYEGSAKLAMGLMGGGAGLAAIGGLMFVIAIAVAILKPEKN